MNGLHHLIAPVRDLFRRTNEAFGISSRRAALDFTILLACAIISLAGLAMIALFGGPS